MKLYRIDCVFLSDLWPFVKVVFKKKAVDSGFLVTQMRCLGDESYNIDVKSVYCDME